MRIVLTGGGTAGHVMPHIAMLPYYRNKGWECIYIGGKGIEKDIAIENNLVFYEIQTGKLRRYFSFENFLDVFRIVFGFFQSLYLLRRTNAQLVFSKGGFVSVPVAYAAWFLRIPVVSHESDLTPGLANKLMKPICRLIFCAFPETIKFLKPHDAVEVGIPVRAELLKGEKDRGRLICGFDEQGVKTLLVMGGSSGAERINNALNEALPYLVERYQIVHLTGRGKLLTFKHPRYRSFEFLTDGLADVFALADAVVSRSGANSIFELRVLKKPMLLIPLEIASRGDQVDNALSFEKKGIARVLRECDLNYDNFIKEVTFLMDRSEAFASSFPDESGSLLTCEKIIFHLDRILEQKS